MLSSRVFSSGYNDLPKPECPYSLKLLYPESFSEMYLPEWKNALCEERKQLDKIAVGAYDGERLVGLAGGSRGL